VATQPSGKILVAVWRKDGADIARLRRDGSLDRSFGKHGFAPVGDRGARSVSDVIIGPSGEIDVAGDARGVTYPRMFVVQLSKKGVLDRSFGINGVVVPFESTSAGRIGMGGLAVSSDGNLLVGAQTNPSGCFTYPCDYDEVVARMTPNGQLDTAFGTGGVAEIPIYGSYVDLAVAPDGDVVTGTLGPTPVSVANGRPIADVSRLLADGSLDPSFGAGSGSVDLSTPVNGVALSDDGLIYAGGASEGLFGATALGSDGSVDQLFGSGGVFATQIGEGTGGYGDFLREANGDLLIAGPTGSDCRSPDDIPEDARCRLSTSVVRLDATGNVDTAFGEGGVAQIAIPRSRKIFSPGVSVQLVNSRDGLRAVTSVSSGPYESAHRRYYASAISVAALRNDGSLDRDYGNNGLALIQSDVQ
jgi:uncharacterized delta-60 repeat protein